MAAAEATHTMQCMEVWGGNSGADSAVAMPGLDARVYNRPHAGSASGGDVYYVSSCATGRVTRVLLADVAGHGEEVAAVADVLRALMRRYVNYVEMTRLARVLNREFSALAKSGRFATAVIATYWGPTREVALCNAGHPRPLWYRGATQSWEIVAAPRADGPPAGLMDIPLGIAEPAGYAQFGLRLGDGDRLLLYTDSLLDAADPQGRRLREQGLLEIVQRLNAARPEALIPSLLERVRSFSGGAEPDDDLTVLLLSPNEVPQRRRASDWARVARAFASRLAESVAGRAPFPWPERTVRNIGGAFVQRLNGRADR